MPKDDIFKNPLKPIPQFEFNDQVARVFDDMLERSIPLYREIINRQAQMIKTFYQANTRIFDLGCSNGNLGRKLGEKMRSVPFEMIAVDNSMPMLQRYAKTVKDSPHGNHVDLVLGNIQDIIISRASVVVINFTLQFLPKKDRDALINKIYEGLVPDGILLFSEKVIHPDRDLSDLQTDFYYGFKKENGYSELEISQKREALENFLIPETIENHLTRLNHAGFHQIDIWLKWFNFSSWICVK